MSLKYEPVRWSPLNNPTQSRATRVWGLADRGDTGLLEGLGFWLPSHPVSRGPPLHRLVARRWCEPEFFIGNLLVRIHSIIVMIRWTGLALIRWTGLTLAALLRAASSLAAGANSLSLSLLLSSLELSDTQVYEPSIRARLGTATNTAGLTHPLMGGAGANNPTQ